jgi:hypothetical protein
LYLESPSRSAIAEACLARWQVFFLLLLTGCSPALVVPETFPELDPQSAQDSLLVATREPGAYLPQFEACEDVNAICIDPPPFWFRGRSREAVFGSAPSGLFVASTTDHFGMESLSYDKGPSLLRLRGDGHGWIMPRYANAPVQESRDGDYFLVLWNSSPIWWLPCDAMSLAQSIASGEFKDPLIRPLDFLSFFSDDELKSEHQFFEVSALGVTPKFGISISKLAGHLRDHYSTSQLPDCRENSGEQ